MAPGAPDGRSTNTAVLKNTDIVKMVAAGLSDDVILQAIRASPSEFTTTPDALVELKTAKVSDTIIAAMIAARP